MADRHSNDARSRRSDSGRQSPSRRNDVIRCENCGEDYSTTYKRCPFCDERAGRRSSYVGGGKRVANTRGGGYGGPINPLQVVILVLTLAVIVAAAVIVFKFISSGMFAGPSGSSSSTGTSQSAPPPAASSAVDPAGQPGQEVSSLTLDRAELSLRYNETFKLEATVVPATVTDPVVWTSSDPAILLVDQEGNATNMNTSGANVRVVVTATLGSKTAQCEVFCRASTDPDDQGSGGQPPAGGDTGTTATGKEGTIVNAEKGLNVRSGPGTSHGVVASVTNGGKVTILGEENGFYKVEYSPGKVGYVSKDYVSVG